VNSDRNLGFGETGCWKLR